MGKVKQEILQYLKKNRFCVLCTFSSKDLRATPVRYWSDDLKINIFSEKFTAKFKLLEKNPKVSLGIYTARRPLKGLQLWGKAEVITYGDPRHETHLPSQVKKNPRLKGMRKILHLIQITPNKIVMLDQSRQGTPFLQWEIDKDGKEREQEIKTLRGASKL
jgi:uncharacterized protein YhbP (UPF0306 family)